MLKWKRKNDWIFKTHWKDHVNFKEISTNREQNCWSIISPRVNTKKSGLYGWQKLEMRNEHRLLNDFDIRPTGFYRYLKQMNVWTEEHHQLQHQWCKSSSSFLLVETISMMKPMGRERKLRWTDKIEAWRIGWTIDETVKIRSNLLN